MECRNWKDEIELRERLDGYKKEFINMQLELHLIWDANLRQISVAKHRLQLMASDTFLIHSAPCRNKLKARELQEWKSTRRWRWTSLGMQKRNVKYQSCLTEQGWFVPILHQVVYTEQCDHTGLVPILSMDKWFNPLCGGMCFRLLTSPLAFNRWK